ncbi:MAG TPA: hypothetical protein DDZ96_06200 [Porphyromonadaceae bacterium]|nr:hypothetical protein [Porphyromonadaceae bacterium]
MAAKIQRKSVISKLFPAFIPSEKGCFGDVFSFSVANLQAGIIKKELEMFQTPFKSLLYEG